MEKSSFDFVRELEVEVCHGRIGTIFNRDKQERQKSKKNDEGYYEE